MLTVHGERSTQSSQAVMLISLLATQEHRRLGANRPANYFTASAVTRRRSACSNQPNCESSTKHFRLHWDHQIDTSLAPVSRIKYALSNPSIPLVSPSGVKFAAELSQMKHATAPK
ncbi:hypothetical protein CSKR_200464 [Clonorchis sinensis]|uniref:Uncharacterized protein n=1 Tax=Clonorchis sinensis TaxID=79923 RepID=A0A8T1MEH4_CLOSI|nr:hypothetical protein CSKR_200464 [Clonorchis sinensis]